MFFTQVNINEYIKDFSSIIKKVPKCKDDSAKKIAV